METDGGMISDKNDSLQVMFSSDCNSIDVPGGFFSPWLKLYTFFEKDFSQ